MMKTCPVCNEEFDPMWRIEVDAQLDDNQLAGVLAQVVYCSKKCRDKARNKRFYNRHRQKVIDRNNQRQKEARRKKAK